MAEENIEVSAGCSHERLQFGHALPHLFFFSFFFLDSQNFGSVGSVKREIKLVWPNGWIAYLKMDFCGKMVSPVQSTD